MGWSCNAEASRTLTRITDRMVAQSKTYRQGGMSNVYTDSKGVQYIVELSRKEHDDGAITGTVMKVVSGSAYADGCSVVRGGTFKIDGNGTVVRGPAWLKALAL